MDDITKKIIETNKNLEQVNRNLEKLMEDMFFDFLEYEINWNLNLRFL